jgi:hypothetical protein
MAVAPDSSLAKRFIRDFMVVLLVHGVESHWLGYSKFSSRP